MGRWKLKHLCRSLIYFNGFFAEFRVLVLCCCSCGFSAWGTNGSTDRWFLTFEETLILRHLVMLLTPKSHDEVDDLGFKTNIHLSSPTHLLITWIIFAPSFLSEVIVFHCNGHQRLSNWFLRKLIYSNLYCAHHVDFSFILWRPSYPCCNKVINTTSSEYTCR